MTSIKLINPHPLFTPLGTVPEFLPDEEIVVISGNPGVFQDVPLSSSEADRAVAMNSPRARAGFTAARRILRFVLSKWTAVPPMELEILPDEHGKPRFVTDRPLHFSITHSTDRFAIAFSRNRVGIDLECARELDAHALASRFFPPEEADLLNQSTDPALFFKLWTCREAAIKGDGRGLSKLLGVTRVTPMDDGNFSSVEVLIASDRWDAIHWKTGGALHGALAFQKKPSLISWCDLG